MAAGIDSRVIHLNDFFALFAVAFDNRFFHFLNRLGVGDYFADFEEGGLHNGVGTISKAELASNFAGVDDKATDVVFSEVLFYGGGEFFTGGVGIPWRIEQEDPAGLEPFKHIVFKDVSSHMAGDKIGTVDEVGRTDRAIAKAEMGGGKSTGFLGVVGKVGLAKLLGGFPDYFDGIFVRADGAVGTEAVEFCTVKVVWGDFDSGALGKRASAYIVHDSNCEMVFRFFLQEIFVNCNNLRGGHIFTPKSVTTGNDLRRVITPMKGLAEVEIEGVAVGAGFFGAIEGGNAANGWGEHFEEVLQREGAVKMDIDKADFFALFVAVVDDFLDAFGDGTHSDNDVFGIGGAVIGEGLVVASGKFGNFGHVSGDDVGDGLMEGVAGLAGLKEDIGVLGGAPCDGVLGVEGSGTKCAERLLIEQGA